MIIIKSYSLRFLGVLIAVLFLSPLASALDRNTELENEISKWLEKPTALSPEKIFSYVNYMKKQREQTPFSVT